MESRKVRKKVEAIFAERPNLSERDFYEKYFAARGVPFEIAAEVRKVLEGVLDYNLSSLSANGGFATERIV